MPTRRTAHAKAPNGMDMDLKMDINCAEVGSLMELIKQEGHCYIKNHMLMQLSGHEGGELRDWHNHVTKDNLKRLKDFFSKAGIPLPFPMDLEERENQLKESLAPLKGTSVLLEGECLMDLIQAGQNLEHCYAEAFLMSSNDAVRDIIKTNKQNVTTNYPKLMQSLQNTEHFYPPPVAKKIRMQFNTEPLSMGGATAA